MIIVNNEKGDIVNLPENSAWELYSAYKEMDGKIACSIQVFFPEGDNVVTVAQWNASTEEEARLQTTNVKAFIANSFTLPVKMCVLDIVGIIKEER